MESLAGIKQGVQRNKRKRRGDGEEVRQLYHVPEEKKAQFMADSTQTIRTLLLHAFNVATIDCLARRWSEWSQQKQTSVKLSPVFNERNTTDYMIRETKDNRMLVFTSPYCSQAYLGYNSLEI